MNYDWLFRVAVSIVVRLVPALIGLRYWKRYGIGGQAFICLLSYDVVSIIVGGFLAYYYHNNIIMSNIYAITEVVLLSIFYKQFFVSNAAKKIFYWFPVLYGIVFSVLMFFVTGIHEKNPAAEAVNVIFVIMFSSMVLGKMAGEEENLIRKGHFWIILGLLSYYLLNGGYLVMKFRILETKSDLIWGLHNVLRYSFYVVNMFYALGLWLIAKERKNVIAVTESKLE